MFTEKELRVLKRNISSEQLDDFISKIQFPTNCVDELDDLALFLLRKFPNDVAAQIFSFMAADDKYNNTQDEIVIQDLHVVKKSAYMNFIKNKLKENPYYIRNFSIDIVSNATGWLKDFIELAYEENRHEVVVKNLNDIHLNYILIYSRDRISQSFYTTYKNGDINCSYFILPQNS